MGIKRRISKLEKIMSFKIGEIFLLEELNKDLYVRYDSNFNKTDITFTAKEVIALQEHNNVLLINFSDRSS